MAPTKKGTKRAADTQTALAEQPLEKKVFDLLKCEGISVPVYKAVLEALEHPLLDVSAECREMLLFMAPKCLCLGADARHEMQQQCVDMIGTAMREVKTKLQAAFDVEAAKASESTRSSSGLEGEATTAKVALAEATEAVDLKMKALAATSDAVVAAKEFLQAKTEERRTLDAGYLKIMAEKDALEASIANDFTKLRDGSWEEGNVNKHYATLAALFGKFHLDDSLLAVLPGPLLKKPDDRGSFDLMAVTQLDESLTAKVAEWVAELAQHGPEVQVRADAALMAQQSFDEAGGAQREAAGVLSVAKEKKAAAAAKAKAAENEHAVAEAQCRTAVVVRDQSKEKLEMFDYSLGNFQLLKDRVSATKKAQDAAEECAEPKPAVAGA